MSANWDQSQFDRTLTEYMQVTSRTVATVINTKAFYIARRAVIETPRTPAASVRQFIDATGGKIVGRLINKRRGERGEKGLYGKEMALAVAAVKAARMRSRAFLASGWLSAIKTLEPLAEKIGAPRKDSGPKQYGGAKGYGIAAHESGHIVQAVLANLATAKWDKGGAQNKGKAALQRAFDFEVASMISYLNQRLTPDAEAWNRLQR